MTSQQPPPMVIGKGIVKQVNSGDTILIRGLPKGGPPEEITIGLTGITAPKLARRPNNSGQAATKDEPFAWEAREYLRKKLVGKWVCFSYEKNKQGSDPKTQKQYGIVYDNTALNTSSGNVTEDLVAAGLVDVRRNNRQNEFIQKLCELEDGAKAAGKGKHGQAGNHVREIVWTIEDPDKFIDDLDKMNHSLGVCVKAIPEFVVDGATVRVCMYRDDLPAYYYAKVMLTGIRCCGFTGDGQTPEPYALEAKFFTESRILQRDMVLRLEASQNKNFFGTFEHPNGNITELLLKEGFAKIVPWSMNYYLLGQSTLFDAEKAAKMKHVRIWKDFKTKTGDNDQEKRTLAKIVEIVNADALVIQKNDNTKQKIFLSSLRPPRMPEGAGDSGKRIRVLFDVPFMLEAREFLRKKTLGKFVYVDVDFIQPASSFPEKICCSVHLQGTMGTFNLAEELISRGLATCVKYRVDDDQRSSVYGDLLAAEERAIKAGKGMHSKKAPTVHRIVDLSGDLKSSKQYFSLLQRAGKIEAVVEFVSSGSRFRLYLPRQNYVITFLLAGISCPKPSRDNQAGDPFGNEAMEFIRERLMQRDVTIEIDSMDKAGNYIGYLWEKESNKNISCVLVNESYADIHPSASKSQYYEDLKDARLKAQEKKEKIWEDYKPVEPTPEKEELVDRVLVFSKVTITETKEDSIDLIFYAQHHEEGPELEKLMAELRQEFESNPPVSWKTSLVTPKKGDLCAVQYSADGEWYRGKILKIQGPQILVSFIDFGNKEYTNLSQITSLPHSYRDLQAGAREYALAFIKLPKDSESAADARSAFYEETSGQPLMLATEYESGAKSYVTLVKDDNASVDIGKKLIESGYVLAERVFGKEINKLKNSRVVDKINKYFAAQEIAKKNRENLWQYGDITEDDAKEFG